ncbi:MAG: hypothetical protein Q7J48_12575 [Nocardioides sp.]|nr:hypothetical protein [Nocardioides sp.]
MNTTVKLLVPLSTLAVAAAVVVGSGATWTSTTQSAITATAGSLVQANSQNGATLAVTKLEPGSTQTGSLTITNTGDLDGLLTVNGASVADGFADGAVTLTIDADPDGVGAALPVEIYSGDFDGIDDAVTGVQTWDGGALATGASAVFTFTVEMAADANHVNQGKTADASLSFVLSQDGVDESNSGWSGTPTSPNDEGTKATTP